MVRDLLRKRGQLVHQRTANLLSIQSLTSRTTGNSISAQYIKALDIRHVGGVLPNPGLILALKANLAVMNSADAQIEILDKAVQDRVKLRPQFRFLKTPGHLWRRPTLRSALVRDQELLSEKEIQEPLDCGHQSSGAQALTGLLLHYQRSGCV